MGKININTEEITKIPLLQKYIDICPICGSKKFANFAKIPFVGGYLSYHICKGCGLVFQSPQMDEDTKKYFYEDNYRLYTFGQSDPPNIDLDIQIQRANHLVELLKPFAEKFNGKVHLDIGCGLGILLGQISKSFGTISSGIEPDNTYRQYTITHQKLNAYSNLSEWKISTESLASLVTISHVLEHLSNPISYLQHIRANVLDKDGLLIIEVPNLFFHYSFDLAHTYTFTPSTIRECLQKSGYRILFHKYHGIPLRMTPRYITIIAQANDLVQDELYLVKSRPRSIQLKRTLGISIIKFEDFIYRISRKVNHIIHNN